MDEMIYDLNGAKRSFSRIGFALAAILVVGIVCIVLGVRNGGMADVLGKAIRICTECIGLG